MMNKLTSLAVSALTANLMAGCMGDNQAAPIEHPQTCAELAQSKPKATDGEFTLFADGDEAKPWKAYCADLGTANPKEYLTLIDGISFSEYLAGGSSPGTDVRTEYNKVRIDPLSFTLDTSDQTFAVSTGSLVDAAGKTVTSMPLGVAMSCGAGRAFAQVNLDGTPFVIEQYFTVGGDQSTMQGNADRWQTGVAIEMWADGNCGWIAPDGVTDAMTGGADLIQLGYKK